jgi:hypothetical protein
MRSGLKDSSEYSLGTLDFRKDLVKRFHFETTQRCQVHFPGHAAAMTAAEALVLFFKPNENAIGSISIFLTFAFSFRPRRVPTSALCAKSHRRGRTPRASRALAIDSIAPLQRLNSAAGP